MEDSAVFDSGIDPVTTTVVAPTYAAEMQTDEPQGRIVRLGEHTREVPNALFGVWLNDGRFLVSQVDKFHCEGDAADTKFCSKWSGAVLDLRTGDLAAIPGVTDPKSLRLPDETLHRVNLWVGEPTFDVPVDVVYGYDAALKTRRKVDFPGDGRGGGTLHSIGDWDYAGFSVGDEESTDRQGYLKRNVDEGGEWKEVLVNQRLVDLSVARNGSALLGVQQDSGELCEDCERTKSIVEIDPASGEIVRNYGVPAAYDKSWKVAEIDKVDGRVLVRYAHAGNLPKNLGVWAYDGSWKLVPGTDGPWTWWQGPDDRIEIEPDDTRNGKYGHLWYFLYWVHGGERTKLEGHLPNDFLGQEYRIPGSLIPLD